MENTYALITGSTAGIGLDLARHFAKDGINLIIVGRNEEKLAKIPDQLRAEAGNSELKILTLKLDLSDKAAPQTLFDFVESNQVEVKYLVNNAGEGLDEDVADTTQEQIDETISVHVLNLTKIVNLFIPNLERNSGQIMNVSSIAGFVPNADLNIYSSVKTYIYNFSLGLRGELRKRGIGVTVLCPPITRTQFYNRANTGYQLSSLYKAISYSSEFVARRAYYCFCRNKAVVIPGLPYWIMCTFGVKLVPWRLFF